MAWIGRNGTRYLSVSYRSTVGCLRFVARVALLFILSSNASELVRSRKAALLGFRYWGDWLGTGRWALGTRHWALGTGHWALGTGQ
jgi:hypothetical protein